jgi:predicted NAD-dependent protein-ADP-ribosyltransferase YbiA (DUF1768 family)
MPKERATEFYYNEKHKQQDAKLHETILDAGDHDKAEAIGRKVAKQAGLTEAEIAALFKPAK